MQTFVRKPFTVQAEQITRDNIDRIAEKIGELKHKDNGEPYIVADRNKIPTIRNVYLGFWLTTKGRNLRCYTNKFFKAEFAPMDEDIDQWIEYMNRDELWETYNRRPQQTEELPFVEETDELEDSVEEVPPTHVHPEED